MALGATTDLALLLGCSLLVCLVTPSLASDTCAVPKAEVQALKDLYEATNGQWAWKNKDNWMDESQVCAWHGVTCTSCAGGASHVQVLNLEWNELEGNLTSSLGALSHLEVLNLATNNLQGQLPGSLGKLGKLRALRLSYNRFKEKFPRDLYACKNLEVLDIPYNDFVGNINEILDAYPKLRKISIRGNRGFSGDLALASKSFKKMKNLQVLDFHMNFIGGVLPRSLFRLKKLEEVVISKNVLSGPLPSGIRAPKLRILTLNKNFLNGTLPYGLGNLPSLESLDLQWNYISGHLPPTLGQLKNLKKLHVPDNLMEGPIPDFVYGIKSLEELDLSNNDLYGSLSPKVKELSQLRRLALHSCRLTGTVPEEVGSLEHLKQLVIYNNKLSGVIPESVGNCDKLEYISMRSNVLSGAIPKSIGKLHQLKRLELNGNELTSLPESIGDCELLTYLMLQNNKLEGTIPSVLGYLEHLRTLALHDNRFTGDSLPSSLSNLMELEDFTAHDNLIKGNPWPHVDSSHSNEYNKYPSCDDLSNHSTGKPFRSYFRVCGTRNDFFVDIFLQEKNQWHGHEWLETHGANWHSVYGKCKANSVFGHHYDYQRAAQYQDMFEIADKSKFAAHNRQLRETFNGKHYDFHPPTFRMPFEYDLWKKEQEKHPEGYWLLKPTASCCGQNIKLIQGPDEMPGDLGNWVIQRFVHPPQLINGHKYVLRLFAIVTSFTPLRVYLFPDGDVFYTHANYTLDPKMTSQSRGFFISDYFFTMKQREMFATSTHLFDHFRKQGLDTDAMWLAVQDVVVKSLLTGERRLRHQENLYDNQRTVIYEVLGYDILFDADYKPWVCEVNTAPNLGLEINKPNDPVIHEEDFDLKTRLMRQTLEIVRSIPLLRDSKLNDFEAAQRCEETVENKLLELGLHVNESAYCHGLQDFQCITRDEIGLLKQFECEFTRRGEFELMFPASNAEKYLDAFPIPRRENYLMIWWHKMRPKHQRDPDVALGWSRPVERPWRKLTEEQLKKHKITDHQECIKWNTEENGEFPDPNADDGALALDDDHQFKPHLFPEDAAWDPRHQELADESAGQGTGGAAGGEEDVDYNSFTDEQWAEFFKNNPQYNSESVGEESEGASGEEADAPMPDQAGKKGADAAAAGSASGGEGSDIFESEAWEKFEEGWKQEQREKQKKEL